MNEKAASLGMTHTAFANPSGLDEAGLTLGQEVKARGLTPTGDPRILGIVAAYTGREIATSRYCSRLVLPIGPAEDEEEAE